MFLIDILFGAVIAVLTIPGLINFFTDAFDMLSQ